VVDRRDHRIENDESVGRPDGSLPQSPSDVIDGRECRIARGSWIGEAG